MKVATNERNIYGKTLFLEKQWRKMGYEPKKGEKPERMWANANVNPKQISEYYYDYQVQKINKEEGTT